MICLWSVFEMKILELEQNDPGHHNVAWIRDETVSQHHAVLRG